MANQSRHLIFISYRGSDQNWAAEFVYARMTEAFGTDAVFKAGNALRAGENFPPVLRREAASCPVMLACIGPEWLAATAPGGGRRLDSPDDWVREEIAISLQAGNHVAPLLIGNHNEVTIPKPDQVPESIRAMVHRQAVWLAPGRGLDATIPMLVDRLAELVPELAERRRNLSSAKRPSAAQTPRDEDQAMAAAGTTMATRRERRRSAMAAGEVAEIVNDAWPYVSAAVAGYGAAVLKTSEDAAASATVSLGRRILQRVFGRGQPPEVLADLASDPQDADLQAALRVALRKLLAEDDELLAQVRDVLLEAAAQMSTSNTVRDSTVHGSVTQVGTINGDFKQK
jgi:TIR domain